MADGPRLALADDGTEQLTLEEEARLIRRVRWRLVAWSGLSTMVVLVVLGVALYAAAGNALAAASIGQLQDRINLGVQVLQGSPSRRPDLGYVLGAGNTLLYLFDANGNPISDRPVAIPVGLPAPASLTAAQAAPDGTDVRTGTLQIASGQAGELPVRIMTQTVVAFDGNTYYLQALQDRSTEVSTLNALLTVLLLGGVLVVIVSLGFGTIYANRALVPIRQSLDAQRDALRRQREFAADASHELRTPLTVIRSSLEHLSRHRNRPISESADAQEALDDIDAEVTHLSSLVGDLLLLARSDSGAVVMEQTPVDLGDIAFDAASAVGRTAENRGVGVLVDPEPTMVTGDSARLRQLVMILADNAVRHSPRHGQVGVTVRSTGGIASIEVTDQGPGVRDEDMAHVFDRFWRAPGAPSGGTGLGLAIARWIVDQHHGRIGVANRPEGGASFRVELPLTPGSTLEPPSEPPAAPPAEPPASPPVDQPSGRVD